MGCPAAFDAPNPATELQDFFLWHYPTVQHFLNTEGLRTLHEDNLRY